MNPFINPVFLIKIAKSYLSDVSRVWYYDEKKLKDYKDSCLKKMVSYAYTVPLYNKKYKEYGVHPDDIKGIDDITKLPFITKDDLRQNYPDGIIPRNFDKKNSFLMSTSGSTGKPVFVYIDTFSAIKSLEVFVREIKAYHGNWRKTKIALIIDLSPGSVEYTFFAESTLPFIKKFLSLKNIKYLDIAKKPEDTMQELHAFNPAFIGTDPNMLRQLAFLKNNGKGTNLAPKIIFSSGSMLDNYTRMYIEKAFDTKIADLYGTTEAGPLAFQCPNKNYHIHSDFVHIELLDKENTPVKYDTPGHVVVTKLYGRGTPIIRYTGIDDIAIPIKQNCSCGIKTEIIKQIEGRSTDLIVLPNGKTFSPLNITGIPAKIMEEFKTYKIKQFQIIQHKKDEIEVKIVIDEKLRNIGPSVKKILTELKKIFENKIGHDVKITINEVNEIQKDTRADYVKVVISKIKQKNN
jgi:phenylacetate-CoA ligase